jgi:hypothetical protein
MASDHNPATATNETLTAERRKAPRHVGVWTHEIVVKHGLGVLEGRDGLTYTVRLDGRADGPLRFKLSSIEMTQWNNVRRLARGLDQKL